VLFSLKEMQDYQVRFAGGEQAAVRTVLIDDFDWVVRYLAVHVDDRVMLLSPYAVDEIDFQNGVISVDVTREMALNSPQIGADMQLSRELEQQLSDHYQWPYYWEPGDVPNTSPGDLTAIPLIELELDRREEEEQQEALIPETGSRESEGETTAQNIHLRSTNEIFGYSIHTTNDDRDAGKLTDLIIQAENWNIQYLVVNTGGRLGTGKSVLVSPTWVQRFDENRFRVDIDLKEDSIHSSPAFTGVRDLTPEYQAKIQEHFTRK